MSKENGNNKKNVKRKVEKRQKYLRKSEKSINMNGNQKVKKCYIMSISRKKLIEDNSKAIKPLKEY